MCHMSFRGRTRLALFSACVSIFLAGAASAAGNYSQDFSSGAPNWVAASGTWQAVTGHYENSTADAPLLRAIAYYGGDSWATDYTFKASLNADYTGTNGANKIGVVFNYTDSSNYHEVLIDMLGNVWLNSVVNGARSSIASGQVSASAVPGIDQWFDVAVSRSANNVSVRVGSEVAISSSTLPSLPAGRIGVFTHYNHGRFDNVSVKPSSQPLLTPIFKTGFGSGVSITAPLRIGPAGDPSLQVWQVDVTGTETATGTAFRPSFWGVMNGRMMNTILPGTHDFDDYLAVSLKTVAGPTGASTRVLSNTVKNITDFAAGPARLGLSYAPADASNVPNKYYVRRYLKFSANLQTSDRAGGFLALHEFKNLDCNNPRRLILFWNTDNNRRLYYSWRMDYANNCTNKVVPPTGQFTPIVEQLCRPGVTGPTGEICPAPPLDQWFYEEYFAEYAGGAQDRLAYAINGHVIFDYRGPINTYGNRGIKLTPGYLDIAPNVEIQVDDLEVFSGIPCANFPCGAPEHY